MKALDILFDVAIFVVFLKRSYNDTNYGRAGTTNFASRCTDAMYCVRNTSILFIGKEMRAICLFSISSIYFERINAS